MKKQIQPFLILGSIIAITFVTQNYFIGNLESQDRTVASFGDRNSNEKIQWEKSLAKEISLGEIKSLGPSKVDWQEKLVQQFIKGKYQSKVKNGLIEKIVLDQDDDNFHKQFDTEGFAREYARNIPNAKEVTVSNAQDNTSGKEYLIYSDNSQVLRRISFQEDESGYVTEISFY